MSIKLLLEVDNHYELYENEMFHKLVDVEQPTGEYDDDYDYWADWADDNIFNHTGVGHEDGDSWYFVKVLESSEPDVIAVGTEWEFGT